MKKLFMVIPLLGYSLTYPDFSLCYQKYKNYSIIPISKNYSITSTKPKHYITYDSKYRIYLIKKNNKNYLHFKDSKLGMWLASIKKDAIYAGNYAEYSKKNIPAKFSTKTLPASIISDTFCNPVGIGVNGGFLTEAGIKKFIKIKKYYKSHSINKYIYAFKDLGIIVNKYLGVTKIIPNSWADKHYIPQWARIIKINDKKIHSLNDIKSLPKKFKITFNINGTPWTSYYKGKK